MLAAFVASIVVFVGYLHIYIFVFHLPLPKMQILRSRNESLRMEAQVLMRQMDDWSDALDALETRDEEVYRSIFGLSSIPASVRDGGLQGENRYEELDFHDRKGDVRELCRKSDRLKKKAYVQSKSYDEIELMLHSADQMATSIPAIWPVVPDKSVRISSPFGYRLHPVLGYRRMHEGIDLSMKQGHAVYATGDGVVEKVAYERRGYGRHVIINHGFGYKTLYAHCRNILVVEGMRVKRGELIAESGNTGISNGAHLHYEIRYKGKPVNPFHYFDRDMPVDQYIDMISKVEANSEKLMIHPAHRKQGRSKR